MKLYRDVIDILLNKWKRPPVDTDPKLASFLQDGNALLGAVQCLAHEAHRVGETGRSQRQADLDRYQAIRVLEDGGHLDDSGLAALFLDYVDQHTGLLLGRGGRIDKPASYSFPHRIFQEYLAGCHLIGDRAREAADQILPLAEENDYWAVAIELAAEELAHNAGRPKECLDLAYHLYRQPDPKNAATNRANLWSAKAAAKCSSELLAADTQRNYFQHYPKQVQSALIEGLRGSSLPAKERAECGVVLNHFGDPRTEITDVDRMKFVVIARGQFYANEKEPQYDLRHDYALAHFPVSNAQFATFVEEDGYSDETFWSLAQQHGYWSCDGFKGRYESDARRGPRKFSRPFDQANHPVVGLSWYEAMAYCEWLTRRWSLPKGCRVILPSENEWLKGARGGIMIHSSQPATLKELLSGAWLQPIAIENPRANRDYPWGTSSSNDIPMPNHANCKETEIGITSALGAFGTAGSPYQLEELAGNVWEWTRTPHASGATTDALQEDTYRVVMGGCFRSMKSGVGCSARDWDGPYYWSYYFGFRVALSPFHFSDL